MYRVIISPYGGHGTSYIYNALIRARNKVAKRPDTVCKWQNLRYDKDYMAGGHLREFERRAGIVPDRRKTIAQNLMSVINQTDRYVLLSGCCSDHTMFLTDNKVAALCIVRHPLHAYVSFFGHMHRNHSAQYGGVDSTRAVEWWVANWLRITDDFLSAPSALIVRYEHLVQELQDHRVTRIADALKGWDGSRRNWGEISRHNEDYIRSLTYARFKQLYPNNVWSM